jgi:tetratricopeptide (TPR) repeat protein
VAEGRFWLSRLLAGQPVGEWTAYATWALGYLSYWQGDTDSAIRELGAVVELLDGQLDPYYARALIFLAGLLDDTDRGPEAVEYVRRSIAAAQPFGVDLQVAATMGMGSVLSERADPQAARYAAEAIALCRAAGSAEQLAAALPTAAMVCWQVGAVDEARAYVEQARPLHAGSRRIARVVMLSAAAAVALADDDIDAAVDFGTTADIEASERGVERELPLIRAVLARAYLARGEVVAAAGAAGRAIAAAHATSIAFPLAVCLETAALVARAHGSAAEADLGAVLAGAQVIRERGDRPASPTLRADVERLRATVPAEVPPDAAAAAALADDLLTRCRSSESPAPRRR